MPKPRAVQSNDPADAAIERVLQAEADAREAINQCRRRALGTLREARARARRVSQRADRRIGRVRRLSDAALTARLESIAAQSRALSDPPRLTPDLEDRLDRSIDVLIDEILDATAVP